MFSMWQQQIQALAHWQHMTGQPMPQHNPKLLCIPPPPLPLAPSAPLSCRRRRRWRATAQAPPPGQPLLSLGRSCGVPPCEHQPTPHRVLALLLRLLLRLLPRLLPRLLLRLLLHLLQLERWPQCRCRRCWRCRVAGAGPAAG